MKGCQYFLFFSYPLILYIIEQNSNCECLKMYSVVLSYMMYA